MTFNVRVSIPHRYAKNAGLQSLTRAAKSVSIPHRYAKNSLSVQDQPGLSARFNSS